MGSAVDLYDIDDMNLHTRDIGDPVDRDRDRGVRALKDSQDLLSTTSSTTLLDQDQDQTQARSNQSYPHEGIIPRTVRYIFHVIQNKQREHLKLTHKQSNTSTSTTTNTNSTSALVINMHISFIEIYNEECKDLLHPDINPRVSLEAVCVLIYVCCIYVYVYIYTVLYYTSHAY